MCSSRMIGGVGRGRFQDRAEVLAQGVLDRNLEKKGQEAGDRETSLPTRGHVVTGKGKVRIAPGAEARKGAS